MRFLGKLLVNFTVFAFLILLLLGGSSYYLASWSKIPYGIENSEIEFDVPKGVLLSDLSLKLQESQLVSHALKFKLWTKIFSKFPNFKAGLYKIPTPISPDLLAKKFIEGSTYQVVKYELLIPEGFTLDSIIERCVNMGLGSRAEYLRLSMDREFLDNLGIGADSIEGFLYPATYYFYVQPTEATVFKEMVSTFWKRLPVGYESVAASRGVTMYEALTFASLIEAETLYEEEKSYIAEVIWNRLRLGMPLGIDAATIYGIKNFDGNLKKDHLVDSANPYNLRVKKGLPPTPINSPTMSSLNAILKPSSEGYLYYVLSPDGSNHHTFTRTLAEHNNAVAKFLEKK